MKGNNTSSNYFFFIIVAKINLNLKEARMLKPLKEANMGIA